MDTPNRLEFGFSGFVENVLGPQIIIPFLYDAISKSVEHFELSASALMNVKCAKVIAREGSFPPWNEVE